MTEIATLKENGFEWIDLENPDSAELMKLAEKYKLHPALVNDCMQPDHLPKYERMQDYAFIIFRIHIENDLPEADSIQELTNKIAIFVSDKFIITIHRRKQVLFDGLMEQMKAKGCKDSRELLNLLIFACLNTYEKPLGKLSKSVDYFEEIVFLRPKKVPLLKGLYYIKRKIDLLRRMLILSFEIIDSIDSAEEGNVNTRDTRDQYVKFQNMFDALSDNIHQLLNIYFSASSQRTNDTMRILTIFSVFLCHLPLLWVSME